jgi:hypothetical protein
VLNGLPAADSTPSGKAKTKAIYGFAPKTCFKHKT